MFSCETASENEDTCVLLMEKGADPNGKQEVDSVEMFIITHSYIKGEM